LLISFKKKANGNLERYLVTPGQELVEAYALLAITERKAIPNHKTISVSVESYVLGLLDCIGELKRQVFDNIRVGKSKEAARIFETMENLYLYLFPFSIYDKILKEARRKLDVNRILLEDTRAALTEEIRRGDMINAIKKLQK
jgi:translin